MNNPINNNVFDSRDLIEYRDSLASDLLSTYNEFYSAKDEDFEEVDYFDDIEFTEEFEEYCAEDIEHYTAIRNFCEELSDSDDFEHGESIIHEDYFTDYCEELLKDCGYIPDDFPSWIALDFEATADNMKVDYSKVEFEGENYYIRA